MRPFLVIAVVALASCSAAPTSRGVARDSAVYNNPTAPIRASVGEFFGIEAVSECRDGFHWQATPANLGVVAPVTADREEFAKSAQSTEQVCGHDVFMFESMSRGSTSVTLESIRREPLGGVTKGRAVTYNIIIE